jgi:hypothetical protein
LAAFSVFNLENPSGPTDSSLPIFSKDSSGSFVIAACAGGLKFDSKFAKLEYQFYSDASHNS